MFVFKSHFSILQNASAKQSNKLCTWKRLIGCSLSYGTGSYLHMLWRSYLHMLWRYGIISVLNI